MSLNVRHIDLSYDNRKSKESALRLITTLFPDWADSQDTIEFIQFKDGITNTVRSIETTSTMLGDGTGMD
jgi:ethanolamine kinase